MSRIACLFGKEVLEARRTWRGPTLLGVMVFCGVLSPLAALAAPALVASLTAGQPGVVIELPDPTYADSYAQWIKNLSQLGIMLVIFSSAGLIALERASGTAALVVTKPVSRAAFVVSRFAAHASLVTVATVTGALIAYGGTVAGFGQAPLAPLAAATGAWLIGAYIAIAVTEALSAVLPALASGVVSLALWGVAGVGVLWRPAVQYTPVGWLSAPGSLLAGEATHVGWPFVTAALLVVGAVALACALFARNEL